MTGTGSRPFHYEIPALYCPFPAAVHPAVDTLTAAGMDFMARHGLCATADEETAVRNIDAGAITASWYPDPNLPVERLQMVTDLVWLYFRLDDLRLEHLAPGDGLAETITLVGDHVAVWESPYTPTAEQLPPHLQGVHDLSKRLASLATPTQAARLRQDVTRWFLALLREGATIHQRTPTVSQFLPMRFDSVAGRMMIPLTGFVPPAEVPGREWDSPTVQATAQAAMFAAMCDNEIFSTGKEQWIRDHTAAAPHPLTAEM